MTLRVLSVLILTAMATYAEDVSGPAFEISSVKAGAPGPERIEVGPGSVTMRNVRLPGCIRWAYSVREDQVSGPAWMSDVWFEITGKSAGPATDAELRVMMQRMLAERFKLTLHRQTKELPSLVLTVAKGGHKLKAVDAEGTPSFKTGKMSLTGKGATLAQLTDFLAHELRFPVIDQTGLTGRFDYFLDINAYVTEEMRTNNGPPPDAPSIVAQAILAQLGLKMDSKKASVEMLMIDSIEKTPTEN